MKEKIKEILDRLKDSVDNPIIDVPTYDGSDSEPMDNIALLEPNACKQLLDYITNLQQYLDNANDIIEKDRQFYKCRMDEYVKLKKENEELNRMCELYSKSLYNAELTDYKSRCEKVNDFIDNYDVFKEFSFPLMKRDIENQIKSSIDYEFNSTFRKKLKNILNGK